MGQYFKAVVIEKHDENQIAKVQVINPRSYDCFMKLTESCYIGNRYVNAVMGMIEDSPKIVAWMGDYADSECGDPYEKKMPRGKLMRLYEAAWGEDDDEFQIVPEPMQFEMDSKGWLLVNHTQKLVLNLDDFIEKNKQIWKYYDREAHKDVETFYCMSPLPLLTACGNGRGGGDYYHSNPDYVKVGTWAFDLIELTQTKPEGFEDVMYEFKEEW